MTTFLHSQSIVVTMRGFCSEKIREKQERQSEVGRYGLGSGDLLYILF